MRDFCKRNTDENRPKTKALVMDYISFEIQHNVTEFYTVAKYHVCVQVNKWHTCVWISYGGGCEIWEKRLNNTPLSSEKHEIQKVHPKKSKVASETKISSVEHNKKNERKAETAHRMISISSMYKNDTF